ncbi:MAG: hypothetical protein JST85_20405 [Acidobacteria bacterium]|nr:hypothetical protein [Acidobacteriota bacterium]
MENLERVRIWFCDCGRVHVETSDCRRSFMPAEFPNFLKNSIVKGGASGNPPRQSHLKEACENDNPASRADPKQLLPLAA